MRYVVFTTRHHNGFSMFDTALSDHNIMHTPYGRDIVRAIADAFRAEGLRVGFYYSLSDWHHPDYPPFLAEHKPYLPGFTPPRPSDEQADRFRAYLLGQLRELLTNYGPIAVLWFDGQWERSPRLVATSTRSTRSRASCSRGFSSTTACPATATSSRPSSSSRRLAPGERWETCFTMNDSWGWNPDDTNYKSPRAIVHALCETAGRGGNLLLNISRAATARCRPNRSNGSTRSPRGWPRITPRSMTPSAGLEPWQFYGPSTGAATASTCSA